MSETVASQLAVLRTPEPGFEADSVYVSSTTETVVVLSRSSKLGRLAARSILGLGVFTGGAVSADALTPSPAHADTVLTQQVYNTDGEGLYLHPGSDTDMPTLSSPVSDLMPDGTTVTVSCWQGGDNVGGDTIWDYITDTATGDQGFVADYYIDTPVNQSNEGPQLTALGLPECGSEDNQLINPADVLQPAGSLQGSLVVPQQTNIYNRQAAVNWAIANGMDQPPASASCTWFASNVLWQGGLAKTPEWTSTGYLGGELHADYQAYIENVQPLPGTTDAWNAPDLEHYLLETYPDSTWEPIDFSPANNDPADAQIGDLVFYDWGQGEGVSHVAVVTKVDPSGYLEVTDWSTNPKDGTLPSPVAMRGVTYSAVNHEWLQEEYPNVSAHLLHVDTTGSPGNP